MKTNLLTRKKIDFVASYMGEGVAHFIVFDKKVELK